MSILQDFREIRSGRAELKTFGLTVGFVLAALGGWSFWRHGTGAPPLVLAAAGTALAALGVVWPAALWPLQKVWMALAVCLGFVMTRVLLAVLYYGVMTPIGLALRASGKDVLERRPKPGAAGYWKDHAEPDPQGPFRQY